jgi:GTPase SAR1 family protein
MSGQSKWRNLWEQHYQDVQAVIFVIDSSDKYRMVVVKDELRALLSSKGKLFASCRGSANGAFFAAVLKEKKSPFLFYANKKDLPGALSAAEICKELELDSISDRPWHITYSIFIVLFHSICSHLIHCYYPDLTFTHSLCLTYIHVTHYAIIHVLMCLSILSLTNVCITGKRMP